MMLGLWSHYFFCFNLDCPFKLSYALLTLEKALVSAVVQLIQTVRGIFQRRHKPQAIGALILLISLEIPFPSFSVYLK